MINHFRQRPLHSSFETLRLAGYRDPATGRPRFPVFITNEQISALGAMGNPRYPAGLSAGPKRR